MLNRESRVNGLHRVQRSECDMGWSVTEDRVMEDDGEGNEAEEQAEVAQLNRN